MKLCYCVKTMKVLQLVYYLSAYLILSGMGHEVVESCSNDLSHSVKERSVSGLLNSTSENVDKRAKIHFKSLRINTIYKLDNHLTEDEQANLKRVLERAIRRMTGILSVKRLKEPLLLERTKACRSLIGSGINKGKCGRIETGYSGEYCKDNLKIPSDHLKGFAVYNKSGNDSNPRKIYYEDGPGIPDTDFVLYVTSKTTDLCNPYKNSALAYAASCQNDQRGRPIAGQVNFCPRTVKAQKFDEELLYKTSLHELFHTLGFSSKLFKKFKNCDKNNVCYSWPKPMVKPVEDINRLVTRAVVREMKEHFNCTTEEEFGGPLEMLKGTVSSHWDPMLMHSSVMASKEQKPYVTLIDKISLAVFEDSGWYKVNYSKADKFIWGKGQGCYFGLEGFCEAQEGFCTDNSTLGCHHLRLSKARCNVNKTISSCGVFAADQKPCFTDSLLSVDEEIYSPASRCFISSLQSMDESKKSPLTKGRCYERRCEEDGRYAVRVADGDWYLCPPGSSIQIPGYGGSLHCAPFETICSDFFHPEPTPSPITTDSSISSNTSISTTQSNIALIEPTTPSIEKLSVILDFNTSVSSMVLLNLLTDMVSWPILDSGQSDTWTEGQSCLFFSFKGQSNQNDEENLRSNVSSAITQVPFLHKALVAIQVTKNIEQIGDDLCPKKRNGQTKSIYSCSLIVHIHLLLYITSCII